MSHVLSFCFYVTLLYLDLLSEVYRIQYSISIRSKNEVSRKLEDLVTSVVQMRIVPRLVSYLQTEFNTKKPEEVYENRVNLQRNSCGECSQPAMVFNFVFNSLNGFFFPHQMK